MSELRVDEDQAGQVGSRCVPPPCTAEGLARLLEFGLEPAGFQERNDALIRRQNDFFDSILHGFRVNEVAVVVVNDKNVQVSPYGQNKETAGRVRVDLAGGGLAVGTQEMCLRAAGSGASDPGAGSGTG